MVIFKGFYEFMKKGRYYEAKYFSNDLQILEMLILGRICN